MAFDPRLSLLRELGGSGFGQSTVPFVSKRIWFLATADTAADVEGDHYFDTQDFNRGDVIITSLSNSGEGTPVGKQYVVVTGKQSGDADNTIALFSNTMG